MPLSLWIVAFAMTAAVVYLFTRDLFEAVTLAVIGYLFAYVTSVIAEAVEVIVL